MKNIKLFCVLLTLLTAFSCSARITGSLSADGSAAVSVNMSLGSRISALIRTMSAAGGQAASGNILDANAISASMSAAPGVSSASFRNTDASSIEGLVVISKIGDFLSQSGGRNFVTFEQSAAGGRCAININKDNGAGIIAMLSPEIGNYLNALMAPVVTGDEMTKAEYLDLIALFYNKAISDEIAASKITASIEFPGAITSVTGGTYSGRRADFDIALADLLVLEKPINLEARWR